MSDRHKNFVIITIIFVVAGILSFHQIVCDDHWWHVATGRLIIENGAVPTYDPFTFTYYGAPWRNNEWGFSLFLAVIWNILGAFGFFLYRWLLLFGTVLFSLKAVEARIKKEGMNFPPAFFIASVLAFLFLVIHYRTNVRPHMLEYFFLAITIFFLQKPPEQLFRRITLLFLVFLTLVWAFLHPSWILLPLLVALTWGDVHILRLRRIRRERREVSIVPHRQSRMYLFLICLVAAIFLFLTKNSGLFSFYLSHLLGMGTIFEWRSYWYWLSVNPFLTGTVVFYILFVVTLPATLNRAPLYILFTVAFAFLSLLIMRFISEFMLLAMPFVAISVLQPIIANNQWHPRGKLLSGALAFVLWTSVAANAFFSDRAWGMGVDITQNPVLIADFMQKKDLEGNLLAKRTAYHSYITFRLWPKVKVFIDGRNTQVFPTSFMEEYATETLDIKLRKYPATDYWLTSSELANLRRDATEIIQALPSSYELIYFNDKWALYMKAETLSRYPEVKPFRMLFPGNIVDENLMSAVIKAGTMPVLRKELQYYGSLVEAPSEKRLYELMRAEIAKYGPVD